MSTISGNIESVTQIVPKNESLCVRYFDKSDMITHFCTYDKNKGKYNLYAILDCEKVKKIKVSDMPMFDKDVYSK